MRPLLFACFGLQMLHSALFAMLKRYLEITAPLHSFAAFFISTITLHGAASRVSLRQWFALVLRVPLSSAPGAPHNSPATS